MSRAPMACRFWERVLINQQGKALFVLGSDNS